MTVKKLYVGDIRIAGIEGKSAYQVWLDAGNTGTEEDYLASLKGDTGATGPQGPAGQDGSDAEVTVTNITNALGYTPASQDSDAIAGNIAMFDSLGNPEDSGIPSENVAEQDGYYETMVVGGAENLIGSDIVSSQFIRRKTGGSTDVGTGVAILKTIKGNTLVLNQLIKKATINTTNNGVTLSNSGTDTFTLNGLASANGNFYMSTATYIDSLFPANHYIYYNMSIISGSFTGTIRFGGAYAGKPDIGPQGVSIITKYTSANYPTLSFLSGADITSLKFHLMAIDLTEMYGSGNEPSSVAEFEAMFPLNYYAYDSGSLLNLTATGLQTNGFNQWDEEWENGAFNTTTGVNTTAASQVRAKNLIPVLPNTQYFFGRVGYTTNDFAWTLFYDSNKEIITGLTKESVGGRAKNGNSIQFASGATIITPSNARYIRFYLTYQYPNTYKNDICINFSDVNKNGTYEPYWSETKALPITTATSGGVAIFSDGMKSAGTAYDEMTATKATKRIGVVDLGTLTWTVEQGVAFRTEVAGKALGLSNIKNAKYTPTTDTVLDMPDKTIKGNNSGIYIYIKDSTYSTAAAFKAAMSGVYLYYVLATPTEYTLDTPFNGQYKVDNDGCELVTPENGSTPTTAPFIADIQYALNATDTIIGLPKNYISKASIDAILTAFKTAGVITNYTLTWDATNQKYNCTITA